MATRKQAVQSLRDDYRDLLRKQREAQKAFTTTRLWQRRIFAFLESPITKIAVTYHLLNFLLIFASMVLSVLSTVETINASSRFHDIILYCELTLLIWFTLEYILRTWSCTASSQYKGCLGRLKFAKSFYMLLDAFIILSTLITTILETKRSSYFTMLRIIRFFQVFRILRVDRQRGDLMTMGGVVYKHRKEMLTCYFVGFIILFGGTYIVYIIERSATPTDSTIDNMVNGIYWAMITVTSVGYGDKSPATWAGKIVTGLFALIGCAFFSLPAGILGSGFALKVAKRKKQTGYLKLRKPAAIVIQTLWRNYSLRKSDSLQGTWTYFLKKAYEFDFLPRNYQELPVSKSLNRNSTHTIVRKREFLINKEGILSDRYKIAIRFIMKLKFWYSIQSFKQCRHPFIDMQDVMEKMCKNHMVTIFHMKELQRSIDKLKAEMEEMKTSA